MDGRPPWPPIPLRRTHPFLRFLAVGTVAVGLNLAMFWLFVGHLGIPYLIATVVVFFVGNGYGFAANRRWVYGVGDQALHRMVLYFATMGVSLGLNLTSMAVCVGALGFSYLLASAITSVWLTPVNYLAHGQVAFGQGKGTRSGRPRILLATHFYADHGGGLEIVAAQLAGRLTDRFEIAWFAAGPPDAPVPAGIEAHPMRAWNGLERKLGLPLPIPSPPALVGIVRGVQRADLVWVHDLLYPSNLLAALAALIYRRPLLVTVHVGMIPYRRRLTRMLMSVALSFSGRLVLTRASAVTFVSARVREEFLARWHLRHEELVPNGLDTALFTPVSASVRAAVRVELGVAEHPLVLFVGRFVERKGLGLLNDLAIKLSQVQWAFAGAGPIDPDGWQLANVHVERGRRGASLAELYGAADLLALPSLGEGFPLVVMEALATGLPVLVDPSTVAGYPPAADVLVSESVTELDAIGRWANRISDLLADADGRQQIGKRGVIFARAHWDWNRASLIYAGLFESLLPAFDPTPVHLLAKNGHPR